MAIEGTKGKMQGEREEEEKKKKQSRGTAELNRGSFPTSFLLLALYPVQQSISFS